jgi:trehalose-phosphatase
VDWILRKLQLDDGTGFPFYIGDDDTDEDAFRELADRGVGIKVGAEGKPTLAHYSLSSPEEVGRWIRWLTQKLSSPRSTG